MSADRDGMERPEVIESRPGMKFVCALPDGGPWALMVFKGRVLTLSQISGLYEITGLTLRKIELVTKEIDNA